MLLSAFIHVTRSFTLTGGTTLQVSLVYFLLFLSVTVVVSILVTLNGADMLLSGFIHVTRSFTLIGGIFLHCFIGYPGDI